MSKQALQDIVNEHETKIFASAIRYIEQSLMDRRVDASGVGALQSRPSMYGFMTFATRQTLAPCQRSSAVALRILMDSRRAPSATSSPTLFRYYSRQPSLPRKMPEPALPQHRGSFSRNPASALTIELYAAVDSPRLVDGLFAAPPLVGCLFVARLAGKQTRRKSESNRG